METLWVEKSCTEAEYAGAVCWVMESELPLRSMWVRDSGTLKHFYTLFYKTGTVGTIHRTRPHTLSHSISLSSPTAHLILGVAAELGVPWRWRMDLSKARFEA